MVSADNGASEERKFSRRDFMRFGAVGIAGAGLLALTGWIPSTAAQEQPGFMVYRGRRIIIGKRFGRPRVSINGQRVVVVTGDGSYRAANFMFSPARTPQELAKRLVDYRVALARS